MFCLCTKNYIMFFKTSVSYGISSGTIKNNHLHFIVCVCFMADEPKKEAFPKGNLCFENLAWERHKRKHFSLQLQYLQIDRHDMYVNFILNRCDDFMQYFMETFINLLENNPYTSNQYNQFCFKYKILTIVLSILNIKSC